jgi:cell division protein FtsI (penicillin-binding protein 3)
MIGQKLGKDRLDHYLRSFGFGSKTGLGFPGESPGIMLDPKRYSGTSLPTISIGQGIAVSAMQMLAAYNTVANGGEYVAPKLVKSTLDGRGQEHPTPASERRRVISERTAKQVTGMLSEVVRVGTGTNAAIDGYTVAGKTGTASKLINRRYSASENNVSFVGFVPSRKPALAIIVMIDAPHAGTNSGGGVAAPIFSRIAAPAMRHLGIAPTINPAPPVLVERSTPPTRAVQPVADRKPVVTLVSNTGMRTMPDLRGLSAREAMRTLTNLGVSTVMSGQGIVLAQDPEPGAPFDSGDTSRLQLGRRPALPRAGDTQP